MSSHREPAYWFKCLPCKVEALGFIHLSQSHALHCNINKKSRETKEAIKLWSKVGQLNPNLGSENILTKLRHPYRSGWYSFTWGALCGWYLPPTVDCVRCVKYLLLLANDALRKECNTWWQTEKRHFSSIIIYECLPGGKGGEELPEFFLDCRLPLSENSSPPQALPPPLPPPAPMRPKTSSPGRRFASTTSTELVAPPMRKNIDKSYSTSRHQ